MRDQVLWVLCGGLVFFTAIVLFVAFRLSGNQAIYTLFSGAFGAFLGGLMVYLKLTPPPPPPPPSAPAT